MGTEAQRGTELCRPQAMMVQMPAAEAGQSWRARVMAARSNGRFMEPREPEGVGDGD